MPGFFTRTEPIHGDPGYCPGPGAVAIWTELARVERRSRITIQVAPAGDSIYTKHGNGHIRFDWRRDIYLHLLFVEHN